MSGREVFDERVARMKARLLENRYNVAGQMYSTQGLIALIDEMKQSPHLSNWTRGGLGRVRERITQYGEDPRNYLDMINNAQTTLKKSSQKR